MYFLIFLIGSIHGAVIPSVSKPRLDGKIVGGYSVKITDFPHQISLQTRYGHICGGSIINEKWVLTAAHCTSNRQAKDFQVRVGSTMHASGGEVVNVKNIVQHKNFNYSSIDWDYSLLELEEDIKFDENKKAIKLPEKKDDVADGTMCKVTGWGNTQSTTESRASLRGADVPIFNQEECSNAYKKFGGVTDRMICAGYQSGGKDACQGDSGGPLVSGDVLIGVVSWGYGCAKPDYPGVYSRVSYIRDWIKENADI